MGNYNNNNEKGLKGERYIVDKLKEQGFKVEWVALSNRMSTADIKLSNNKLIDVKYAEQNKSQRYWTFNFHHHGDKQLNIDFFICVVVRQGSDNLIYVFPNSILSERKTIQISDKSIRLGRYGYFLENWGLLK